MTTIEDCRQFLETPKCYRSDVVDKNKFKPDPQNTDAIYDYLLNTSNKENVIDCPITGQKSGTATGRCFEVCNFDTTLASKLQHKNELCKTIFAIYEAQTKDAAAAREEAEAAARKEAEAAARKAEAKTPAEKKAVKKEAAARVANLTANLTATLNTLIILPTKNETPQLILLNDTSITSNSILQDYLDQYTIKLKFNKNRATTYHDSLINEEESSITELYKDNNRIVECYLFYVLFNKNSFNDFKIRITDQIRSKPGLEISLKTLAVMIQLELIDNFDYVKQTESSIDGNILLKKKGFNLLSSRRGGSKKRTKRKSKKKKSRNKKRKIKRTRRH